MSATATDSSGSTVTAFPRLPSTSMSPFDNDLDLSKNEGISIWNAATALHENVERLDLIVDNGDKICNRVKALVKKFCLEKYLKLPMDGTGCPSTTTR